MKALIVALLFAVVNGGEKGGTLYVHVMPGLQILVDGVDSGVANQSEGGKMIHGVRAGAHRVVVRTPDGREAS